MNPQDVNPGDLVEMTLRYPTGFAPGILGKPNPQFEPGVYYGLVVSKETVEPVGRLQSLPKTTICLLVGEVLLSINNRLPHVGLRIKVIQKSCHHEANA